VVQVFLEQLEDYAANYFREKPNFFSRDQQSDFINMKLWKVNGVAVEAGRKGFFFLLVGLRERNNCIGRTFTALSPSLEQIRPAALVFSALA
jgi:hypothetical protein